MRLLHCGLEDGQVNLSQCALVNDRVRIVAIELRVVSQEVFDRGADALTLHTFDVTDRYARREEGVFAEVLKVPAVHWRAINVYTGSQQKVHAFGACVSSKLGAHAFSQHRIPG